MFTVGAGLPLALGLGTDTDANGSGSDASSLALAGPAHGAGLSRAFAALQGEHATLSEQCRTLQGRLSAACAKANAFAAAVAAGADLKPWCPLHGDLPGT